MEILRCPHPEKKERTGFSGFIYKLNNTEYELNFEILRDFTSFFILASIVLIPIILYFDPNRGQEENILNYNAYINQLLLDAANNENGHDSGYDE